MVDEHRDANAAQEIGALLGAGTRYEGKLTFDGRVRIDGSFRGEVESDGVLIVGDGGTVEGTLRVGALIVRGGKVRGNVAATQSVELHAPAELRGDIHAPVVYIDKGATFEGRCTMATATVEDGSAAH